MVGGLFSYEILEEANGYALLKVSGNIFLNEAGGHRFQRIPPNEKNGRVHTSTITVAVLPEIKENKVPLSDYEITSTKGSGAGGQHRNKNETAVIIKHKSGLSFKVQAYKSQKQNKDLALALLSSKLEAARIENINLEINKERLSQIGTGQRGDKRRTVRTQDNTVRDIDGREWKWTDYRRGYW